MRSRFLNIIFSVALALIACGVCRAADLSQFDAANRLYEAGKYDEAKQAYGAMVKSGPWSANLFYNLGDTEWRLGNAGEAAADYERALILDPSHPQARANLAYVRDQTGARIAQPQWWEQALDAVAPSAATVLLTVCFWAALFCVAIINFRPQNRVGPGVTLALCLLGAAYAGGCLWRASTQATKAVVIAKSVPARVAPVYVAPVADTLPAGSEVLAPEVRGEWTYCTLPDGTRAWVPSDSIEMVKQA